MKKKILALGLMASLVMGTFAGCGSNANDGTTADVTDAASTAAAEKEEYKVVRFGTPGSSSGNTSFQESVLVAYSEGYLEEELNAVGYTAECEGFSTQGVGINEALAAGEVDIALYGDFPAITYIASGNDATIFGLESSRAQLGIYASDDIQSVADLKGKKIATTLGTIAYQYLYNLLAENGLSVDDVEIVNATSDLATLFASGDVDAVATSILAFVSLKDQGGHLLAVNGDSSTLASYYVILGRTNYLNENPDVEAAILKAIKRSSEFASENQDKVYETMADASGYFGVDTYEDYYSFDTTFSFWNPYLTNEEVEKIQETADFMYENQYITSDVNVSDYINMIAE
jgi:sulfonate transport system substrate-binding protein